MSGCIHDPAGHLLGVCYQCHPERYHPTPTTTTGKAGLGSSNDVARTTGSTATELGRNAAEWHRYLHQEGILVEDEGEDCGPWHHRVFLDAPSPSVPEPETPVGPVWITSANCFAGDHDDCLLMVEQDAPELGITDCLCACHAPSPSVTEPETPAAPRTEAGRTMLRWLNHMQHRTGWAGVPGTPAVLRIEAEAAALAARPDATVFRRAIRNVIDADPSVWLEQGDMADAVAAEYDRLASLPTDHNHDGGAHCFSDCPAYTRQVHYASLPTEPEDK